MRLVRALVLCLLPSVAAAQAVPPLPILYQFESAPLRPNGGPVGNALAAPLP
jgi:hypothetical protein